MTGETLENFYDMAAKKHPKGYVSVESFRGILDEEMATKVKIGQHALAV